MVDPSVEELQLRQFGVQAALRHQRIVRALGDDAAAVHHHDAVGLEHGREAMGDDQRRAPAHQVFERGLHRALALRVQRRGRLVQQQDRRILSSARAIAMRCCWPPDRRAPRSPSCSSNPFGKSSMKSSASAASAAARISSSLASSRP